jgi:hypothetical protein
MIKTLKNDALEALNYLMVQKKPFGEGLFNGLKNSKPFYSTF